MLRSIIVEVGQKAAISGLRNSGRGAGNCGCSDGCSSESPRYFFGESAWHGRGSCAGNSRRSGLGNGCSRTGNSRRSGARDRGCSDECSSESPRHVFGVNTRNGRRRGWGNRGGSGLGDSQDCDGRRVPTTPGVVPIIDTCLDRVSTGKKSRARLGDACRPAVIGPKDRVTGSFGDRGPRHDGLVDGHYGGRERCPEHI